MHFLFRIIQCPDTACQHTETKQINRGKITIVKVTFKKCFQCSKKQKTSNENQYGKKGYHHLIGKNPTGKFREAEFCFAVTEKYDQCKHHNHISCNPFCNPDTVFPHYVTAPKEGKHTAQAGTGQYHQKLSLAVVFKQGF